MEWIKEMVYPIIKDCETPEDARKKIIEWGKNQEPRDAACALIMVDILNAQFENLKPVNHDTAPPRIHESLD